MEAMGFREMIKHGEIIASFMSVTVYEARGITVSEGFAEALQSKVAGADYRIAIAHSVNAACQVLIGENYDDAELEWRKRVNSTGPFVLIAVGPTEFVESSSGRLIRQTDGSVITYDCFPSLRGTLQALEQRVIPFVIAATTCALNESDRYVTLKKLERVSAGRCTDGMLVHDMRFDLKAEGYVSQSLSCEALSSKLADITTKAPILNQRAARFFALGASEDDQLKRFLYFFLALEIETHAVFSRIDHQAHTKQLLSLTAITSAATFQLLGKQVGALTNLFDRFVWCATCTWTDLLETDIALFKELKSARDAIAHGKSSEPPSGFARKAEILARKILWR